MTKYIKAYLSIIFGVLVALSTASNIANASNKAPVVVELFTSQGCESCPPAEAFLKELGQRNDIITLEYHIDYWDYIGWKDPFADPAYTQRQRDYAAVMGGRYVYTPQMVFNGKTHEVGSKKSNVNKEIASQQNQANSVFPNIALTSQGHNLNLSISDQSDIHEAYDIIMVGFDNEHITKVTRGENRGEDLVNTNVVRSMTKIGTWQGAAINTTTTIFEGNGGCVVMLQHQKTREILSAASISF